MGQRPRRGHVHVSDTEEENAASAATDEQGVEAEAEDEDEDETATESGHDGPTRSGRRSRKPTALAAASRAQEAAGRTAVMSREARRKAKAARTAATRAARAATLVERLLGRATRIHAAYSCVHPSVVAAVSTVCGACTKLRCQRCWKRRSSRTPMVGGETAQAVIALAVVLVKTIVVYPCTPRGGAPKGWRGPRGVSRLIAVRWPAR